MITDEIVQEFKDKMHLGDFEDDNLKSILSASADVLKRVCGQYDMEDRAFKELVFERSRYVYNDALEYFEDNFLHRINSLALDKVLEEASDEP